MTCNTFIYTILFDLLESSKINLIKDLVRKTIVAKVAENYFFFAVSRYFELNLSP